MASVISQPITPSPTKESHGQRTHSRNSSISSPYPPQIPIVKPNAHPYAIKTTSTALLSRTSSSPHHSSTYRHYVPPSPTSSSGGSPTKRSSGQFTNSNGNAMEGRSHRYSRSMSDAPPALPAPPSRPGSVSPRKAAQYMVLEPESGLDLGGENTWNHTPRQSGAMRRAETLPSSANTPFVFPMPTGNGDGQFRDMNLPEDPKSWDSQQLAEYLDTMVAGEHVGEIVSFVREHGIGGRTFLKFSERELTEYGADPRWASTLLDASRSLRQSTLRGRIWGFANTPESAYNLPRSRSNSVSSSASEDDYEGPELSSNRVRKSNGRVKAMAASFERSSSSGSEHDDDLLTRSRSASPTKPGRGLPPRPRVNDLFSAPPIPTISTTFPTEGDSTLKAHPPGPSLNDLFSPLPDRSPLDLENSTTLKAHPPIPSNRNKELPRLLPFPPNTPSFNAPPPPPQPFLVPTHTGAAYALPASPDPQELGYRAQQKQNGGLSGGRQPRLLPIPPDLIPSPSPPALDAAATVLHHPRPRRGGPPELVQQDEPSIEELLAAEGAEAKGVEGWEVQLGDTVKRISDRAKEDRGAGEEDPDKTVDGVDPGSFVIGRTGRRRRGLRPKAKGSKESVREASKQDSSRGDMAELFEVPAPRTMTESGSQTDEEEERVVGEQQQQHAPAADVALNQRAGALDAKGAELAEWESRLSLRESDVAAREVAVGEREKGAGRREAFVAQREEDVERREGALVVGERDLEAGKAEVTTASELLEQGFEDLTAQQTALESRSASLQAREKVLEARQEELVEREKGVEAKVGEVQRREEDMKKRETTLGLATRLLGRVVAPIFGERFAGLLSSDAGQAPAPGSSEETSSPATPKASPPRFLPGFLGTGFRLAVRSPYYVLLGLGVCAVLFRVLVRGAAVNGALKLTTRVSRTVAKR
ncbi:hypothetical protein DFP72DRAFT_921590 [Ephemerocybe angulata]|uniref:Uncharacterized protein n=1 Tax=Ephemerocybe angulata TaxID=980116 RepID=A0A8H6LXY5_9AGAR|nr:hypothetical protein DFP72DRAFT_921590 [Tulosesus angulatus]